MVAGDNLVYTLSVTKKGPFDATNVVVTDTLPAGVTFVSTSGCAEDPGGVPTCSLGTISSGGSATFTVEVAVDKATSGALSNVAFATFDLSQFEPNMDDNTVTEPTTVTVPVPAVKTWLTWLLSLSLIGAALLRFKRRRPNA